MEDASFLLSSAPWRAPNHRRGNNRIGGRCSQLPSDPALESVHFSCHRQRFASFLQRGKTNFERWVIAPTSSIVNQLISAKRGNRGTVTPLQRQKTKTTSEHQDKQQQEIKESLEPWVLSEFLVTFCSHKKSPAGGKTPSSTPSGTDRRKGPVSGARPEGKNPTRPEGKERRSRRRRDHPLPGRGRAKKPAHGNGRTFFIYFAYSTTLVSRSTWTLIWPGYSSSFSIRLASSRARMTI